MSNEKTTVSLQAQLINLIEAAIFVAGRPLSVRELQKTVLKDYQLKRDHIEKLLVQLALRFEGRGVELVQVASGYRFQAAAQYSAPLSTLFAEKPPKMSRALLETLTIIAYRQPITRADIEAIRGVAVSAAMLQTLHEREWIEKVGHKEVVGRPALWATTRQFLDYFGLTSLDKLPELDPELLSKLPESLNV